MQDDIAVVDVGSLSGAGILGCPFNGFSEEGQQLACGSVEASGREDIVKNKKQSNDN